MSGDRRRNTCRKSPASSIPPRIRCLRSRTRTTLRWFRTLDRRAQARGRGRGRGRRRLGSSSRGRARGDAMRGAATRCGASDARAASVFRVSVRLPRHVIIHPQWRGRGRGGVELGDVLIDKEKTMHARHRRFLEDFRRRDRSSSSSSSSSDDNWRSSTTSSSPSSVS
jgi:hypothetical protein